MPPAHIYLLAQLQASPAHDNFHMTLIIRYLVSINLHILLIILYLDPTKTLFESAEQLKAIYVCNKKACLYPLKMKFHWHPTENRTHSYINY